MKMSVRIQFIFAILNIADLSHIDILTYRQNELNILQFLFYYTALRIDEESKLAALFEFQHVLFIPAWYLSIFVSYADINRLE
jgi:hypothetical protein